MANENKLEDMIRTSLESIRSMIDANTIIGDPIRSEDGTTIIPVSKVSFAFASGGADTGKAPQSDKFGGGAGGGVTVQPIAFLVLKEGRVQLLQLADKGQTVDRVLNMVPETMDRISSFLSKDKKPSETAPAEDTTTVDGNL